MRRGYFTPPVLIILAIIIFAVAIVIAINADFVKRLKNEPSPAPSPTTQYSSPTPDETTSPSPLRTNKLFLREYSDGNRFKNKEVGISLISPKGSRIDIYEGSYFRNDAINNSIRVFYYKGDIKPEEAFNTHLDEGIVVDISQIPDSGKSVKDIANQELITKVKVRENQTINLDPIKSDLIMGYFAYYTPQNAVYFGEGDYWGVVFRAGQKIYATNIGFNGSYVSDYKTTAKQIIESIETAD